MREAEMECPVVGSFTQRARTFRKSRCAREYGAMLTVLICRLGKTVK